MYDRHAILLNPHAVALIHIFTRLDNLEDVWLVDVESKWQKDADMYDDAAKQFVEQLEEQGVPLFFERLSFRCMVEYYKWCNETNQKKYWDEFVFKINKIDSGFIREVDNG